jgi:hypothetical protein
MSSMVVLVPIATPTLATTDEKRGIAYLRLYMRLLRASITRLTQPAELRPRRKNT